MGGGWAVGGGRGWWAVGDRRWREGGGRWAVVGGRWAVLTARLAGSSGFGDCHIERPNRGLRVVGFTAVGDTE